MEKNKSFGPAVREGGARYKHDAGTGMYGYGHNSDLPFSGGTASYKSQPQSAAPINYSGKENFTESKYAGGNGESRMDASGNSDKDDIETMGGNGDDLNRKAY